MSFQFEYPNSVDEVYSILTCEDYLTKRSETLKEKDVSCSVITKSHETDITMDRTMVRELPGFLSKVLKPSQPIKMTETWRKNGEGYAANYLVEVIGQPISVTADIELLPKDSGCIYNIRHSCKVKIPLIGRKLEKYIIDQTKVDCQREFEIALRHLAG